MTAAVHPRPFKVNKAAADEARRDLLAYLRRRQEAYDAMSPTQRLVSSVKAKALSVVHKFSRRGSGE